jgi:hypothetical protein
LCCVVLCCVVLCCVGVGCVDVVVCSWSVGVVPYHVVECCVVLL